MNRRDFGKLLLTGGAFALSAKAVGIANVWAAPAPASDVMPLIKSDAEWKKQLTSAQYHVLREEGTERPFTSPMNDEHRKGVFACVACALPLFLSETKFDSGTGWPSFYDHIPGHLAMKTDTSLLMERTEYHCARCGGHHGHVFTDGPKPTGLRHCNNGVALSFTPSVAYR